MKKTLTLLLLLCGSLYVPAQVPFPSYNAVWSYRHGNGEAMPDYVIVGTRTDDTVFGGNTYHKLYISSNDMVLDPAEYIGGIREGVGGQVYYINASGTTERLLYDFSLSVGDTIFTAPGGSAEGVVFNVDTVTIASVARRRLSFRYLTASVASGGTWIEGIGNSGLGGFFGSPLAQPTCDCANNTVCLTVAGSEKYHNASYAALDCDNIISVSQVADAKVDGAYVSLNPNPVTGAGSLQIAPASDFDNVVITDAVGRVVARMVVPADGLVTISAATMVPGMYIYHLSGHTTHTFTGRFVVE
ncbi:MAG: T9SS type A sorting domain-containing protein [Chitinophagaceae bacterium]|nr:T9SS type A sorting domain-containing protein [Chitinophagaceae bacterium]